MVNIVLDIMRRAAGGALTFVNFVGSIRTHVAIHIQLMVADCAPAIASATEFLIVCDRPLGALACHQVSALSNSSRNQSKRGVLDKQSRCIAQVAGFSTLSVLAIPTSFVTFVTVPVAINPVPEIRASWEALV